MNINLSKPEVDELVNRYRVVSQPGLVDYRTFITKLDTVFYEGTNPAEVIQNARSSAVSITLYPSKPLVLI